jgi:hypothetical protein
VLPTHLARITPWHAVKIKQSQSSRVDIPTLSEIKFNCLNDSRNEIDGARDANTGFEMLGVN